MTMFYFLAFFFGDVIKGMFIRNLGESNMEGTEVCEFKVSIVFR